MRSLEGRVGIVTGGAGGLGSAITKCLSDAGAKIYIIGLSEVRKIETANTVYIQGDVTDYKRMEEIINDIGRAEGIDFLINNAGVTLKKRAEEFTMEEFQWVQEINVNAIFKLSTLCYKYLKESNHIGRIINISSMAAHKGFSEVVPYCVSKSAVLGLTRGLATEWRSDNIRVNSVAPGWFISDLTLGVMDEERKRKILNQIALDTFGKSEDIGNMVRFLLTDEASYITGQDIAVDGGALGFGY